MGIIELLIIAVGLSMDAFAVSICKGLSMKKLSYRNALVAALFFGGFQGIMPLLGYILGTQFEHFITPFDHWIAFILLVLIGGKMIKEARSECPAPDPSFDLKTLTILAIATSIDALAVGVTFAFLKVDIVPAVTFIGVITFALSFMGVKLGHTFGEWFESKAEIAGGVILIGMGLKILLGHLGIIVF